ncbi:MAG: hypothetical protein M5U01_38550 [Ardenticatenaceae bacterium]|nr:hypothetical protein [Ardenticatenaceae bacterium]HBY97323.1 hypothetical protein [Chloroflexota bacterium]
MEITPSAIHTVLQLLHTDELRVINLGITLFAETLHTEGATVVHVDWRPPAQDDQELADMLAALRGKD